jgi:16S rRNA (uracil1498-N3)-methyltransferase
MRIPRFYWPNLSWQQESEALPESVFRHAIQVLRLREGDVIQVFDGEGKEYEARLTHVEKRQARAECVSALAVNAESNLPVTLLQGISRGERMDFAIQKAVELGVNRIIPVVTERCNVQLKDKRQDKKWAHWQGVLISACEQSGRAMLPTLDNPMTLSEGLAQASSDLKLVLDPLSKTSFSELSMPDAVSLLIGPEGGLSEDEIQQAIKAGYTAIQFGPRILRTETAALAALAIVQATWGDLR